jgi:hypothetical protein
MTEFEKLEHTRAAMKQETSPAYLSALRVVQKLETKLASAERENESLRAKCGIAMIDGYNKGKAEMQAELGVVSERLMVAGTENAGLWADCARKDQLLDDAEAVMRRQIERRKELEAQKDALLNALVGVVAVADRQTDEFDAARAAIAAARGGPTKR